MKVDLKEKSYDIVLGKDYFHTIPEMISSSYHYNKVLIVTDETVGSLYLEELIEGFKGQNVDCISYTVPVGESSKSMANLMKLYDVLAENLLSRKDVIIALGGGVVGDLTGFAAATYLRGIDFIQIPTTLLSQVDSSVGGKVAVNIPQGKNLVGNFYQPKAVYIDVNVLNTLNEREISSGLAEIIKYACIEDQSLFDFLEENDLHTIKEHYLQIIKRCLEIKIKYVQADEKETYLRMHLNFGHTIGHAIEKYGRYEVLNHGEAVAMGMLLMVEGAVKLGLLDQMTSSRLKGILLQYRLYAEDKYELDELMSYIRNDKKAETEKIHIILIERIGKSYIKTVPFEWLETLLLEVL